MAAVFNQVGGLAATFVFRDKSKNKGYCSIALPEATLLADAKDMATFLGGQLELGSDAQIQGFSINSRYVAQGAAAPVAGGNVEQRGNLSFLTAGGKSAMFSIPAPKVSIMTADERALDTANAIVSAIVDLLVDGTGAGGPYPQAVDSNKSDLVALLDTWINHRPSKIG